MHVKTVMTSFIENPIDSFLKSDNIRAKEGDVIVSEKKILIVDDEVSVRRVMKDFFIIEGYEVFTAESAEKALEILKKENLMVIFLDLKLPGMNGVDLCRRIRKENQIAIIHAITGYSVLFNLLECREAGFDDYFIKPFDLDMLLKAAKDAFEKLERWKTLERGLAW
jgi:DNA-binding response OmpR family regulator